ncbi:TPA: hypothetical protein DCZ15_03085 [Candidatus Falkowbacteria bacterium]|nr:MAG: hypothetical protein UV95_C0002G0003 [Candidatus Falkowbacteria bacterium GW2011_GWF2_43_32]HBA36833.1 hypothetical protein [Candidatus Falkowbacteria bacterium]
MADPDLAKAFLTISSELLSISILILAIVAIFTLLTYLLDKQGRYPKKANKYIPYKISDTKEYDKQLQNKPDGAVEINYQPYMKKDNFLSPSELKFYNFLKGILGNKYEISTKVRIPDIIQVKFGDSNYSSFNRIKAKHVDFLICRNGTMEPKMAVELDGSSHDLLSRQKRDKFVDEAFANAGIPIAHIKVSKEYDGEEIIKQLRRADKTKYVVKQKED